MILCTRSDWFKKALLGSFEVTTLIALSLLTMLTLLSQEGQTGKVTLTVFTEEEVGCLLHFLYAGSVDFQKTFPEMAILVAIIKTWKMADFFCLGTLHNLLVEALEDKMEEMARCLCTPLASEEKGGAVDRAITDEMLPAIRALYQDDVGTTIRDTILQHVLGLVFATMPYLEVRGDFEDLFREIPQFAVDWATAFVSGMDSTFPALTQKTCAECRSTVHKDKGTVDGFKWVKYRRARLICSDCFRIPTLDDWEAI